MATTRPKVLILGSPAPGQRPERDLLEPAAEIVTAQASTRAALSAAVRDVDALMLGLQRCDAPLIAGMRRCRVICRYGIGYDNIDVDAATAAGIWVALVPDYGWEDVSDHAVALLLACVRDLRSYDRQARAGRVGRPRPLHRLKGRTGGVIGCGGIGRAVVRKLDGFGLARILVHDPYLTPAQIAAAGGTASGLELLLREADFVSLHTPLTAATRHLLGAAQLRLMKPTAILINTARGALVDQEALAAALAGGAIAAAGLDVFETEPLPTDSPLAGLDNVILSNHVAWYTEESAVELAAKAARNVREVLAGRPPVYPVNQLDPDPPAGSAAAPRLADELGVCYQCLESGIQRPSDAQER